MSLPRNSNLLIIAKKLRKNMTSQEKRLWYDFLQKFPVKIYKQKIIGNYIADFYCDKAKYVIELDGSQHYSETALKYDQGRTEYLNSLGIKVIRITNSDCDSDFEAVCTYIEDIIQKTM